MYKTNKYTVSRNNIKIIILGFMLSVILTSIPLWFIKAHIFSVTISTWIILISTILQIIIRLVFFILHTNELITNWGIISLTFTMVICSIIIIGSMWIMWNLNSNMIIH